MSRGFLSRAAAVSLLVAVVVGSPAFAQTGPFDLPPGYSQRERHDPSSSRYMWRDNNVASSSGAVSGGISVGVGTGFFPGWYPPYGRPWGWRRWGYDPYWYGYGYPYGYGYGYPLYPPPVWIPSENIYGPAAVNRMLQAGLASTGQSVPPVISQGGANRDAGAGAIVAQPQPQPQVRRVSDAARARAARYAAAGDGAFRDQKYASALGSYRRASEAAPDFAEWKFKMGQSMLALGRYADAAETIRAGLALDPAAPQAPPRLDVLYGDNQVAKAAHIEALAQAATADPNNADLLFLLGVELFFDGQQARSRKFFERASQISLGADAHLRPFLAALPPEVRAVKDEAPAGAREL